MELPPMAGSPGQLVMVDVKAKEKKPRSHPGARKRPAPDATGRENEAEIRRQRRTELLLEVDTLCKTRWALIGADADPVGLNHFKDGYREGVLAGLQAARIAERPSEKSTFDETDKWRLREPRVAERACKGGL